MMGGGRNGRYWKWSFVVLLFLCLVYVFYLYRDVRSILLDKEKELEDLENLQGRLGQQLKDVVESHSTLQEELKNERVSHHKTRSAKDSLGKQCQEDLKTLKEAQDAAKFKLEEELDSYQVRLEEETEKNEHLQAQQDMVISRSEKEVEECVREKERQEESCQSDRREREDEVEAYKLQLAEGKEGQEKMKLHCSQCDTQLDSLQHAVQLKDFRISSLENDLARCQDNMQAVTSQNAKLESETKSLERQESQGHQVNPRLGGPGVQDSPRDRLLRELNAKMERGEVLDQQELKAFQAIQDNEMQDHGGANFNPGGRQFKRSVPPKFPGGGDQQRGQQNRFPDYDDPGDGNQRQFGYRATNNRVASDRFGGEQHGMEYDQKQLPRKMDYGQNRLPGRMGTRLGAGAGTEKQQLPELAEQEEVKALQLEDQDPVMAQREKKEKRTTNGEEDDGVDEQAFDPADVKEEGDDDRQYDFDQGEEKVQENLNLALPAADKKRMPSPHRVVAQEPEELNKARSPPKFENPDQAFDEQENFNEKEEFEREQEDRQLGQDDGNMEEEAAAVMKDEDFDNGDDMGQRQFEEDMKQDRDERARVFGRAKEGREEWENRQDRQVWNQDAGPGMVRGQREGVEEAMRQEMGEKLLRRQQAEGDMEKLQQDDLQRRLNQHPQFGQRDNLR